VSTIPVLLWSTTPIFAEATLTSVMNLLEEIEELREVGKGEEGFKRVCAHFSEEMMIQRIFYVYKQTLALAR